MIRLFIFLGLIVPMTVQAAPERRGRSGSAARGGGGGASANQSKVRRKTSRVRVKAKTARTTLNVRKKSQPRFGAQAGAGRPAAGGAGAGRPASGRAGAGRASAPQQAARQGRGRATRTQPAARTRQPARARSRFSNSRRRNSGFGSRSYQRSRRSSYRSPARVQIGRRRGPRHPGWSRRHFRVSHHSPLTVLINRSVLQGRLNATRNDLAQVEYAIRGLANQPLRTGLMQHVRAIGFALDDIDSALIIAPYHSRRRGWVVLDQRSFWRRLQSAENALAHLDNEVAGLQDAQNWNGHARLGGLDTNLDALGTTLMGADAYGVQATEASRPAAMSVAEFEVLEQSLHATTFRDEKLAIVRRAVFSEQFFMTVQARAIARQLHAGKDKVTVLTWLHPRLVDPDRFGMVMDDLPTNADRRRLNANVYGQ